MSDTEQNLAVNMNDNLPVKVLEFCPHSKAIHFYVDGHLEGSLFLDPPMRFEGDAEKSAKLFFDYVCRAALQGEGE